MIRCALAEIRRPLTSTPRARSASSSSISTRGSITTPLPITQRLPGYRIPDGIRWSFHSSLAAHDRVAGVVAALEAHDRVGLLGEQVGDLALALVAPLGADYHDPWHAQWSLGALAPARRSPRSAGRRRSGRSARNSRRLSSPYSGIRSPQISTRRETVRVAEALGELVAASGSSSPRSRARPRSAR